MPTALAQPTGHPRVTGPVAAAVGDVHAAIDRLAPVCAAPGEVSAAGTDPSAAERPGPGAGAEFVSGASPARVIRDLDRAIARLQGLRLQLIAAADRDRVADSTAMTGTGAWLAAATRTDTAAAAAQVALATALAGSLPTTQAALAAGDLTTAHASVIAQTSARLPADLTAAERAKVETALVAQARHLDPARLRTAGRRALALAERSSAEAAAHADRQLREDEDRAEAAARLTMHDNGNGTTTGHFTVPTLAASILRKVVQQLASPRRQPSAAPTAGALSVGTVASAPTDWAHRHGEAFVELLEHLPTDRLHSKTAATIVVTLDLETLREGLGAAHVDTGHELSATQARRLACQAGLIPVVLGGQGQPLDLGRADRFFTEAQRTALATRYTSCAATGCDRPYAWSELHHQTPWHRGGRTDLDNALPLCGYHHRRIHDPRYHHRVEALPGGTRAVLFSRRP